MTGRAQLPSVLFDYDFVALMRCEKNARVRMRLLGLAHLQEGKTYTEVAGLLKVEISAPRRWVNRLVVGGLAGLQEQAGRGRKRRLDATLEPRLQEAVEYLRDQRSGGRSRAVDIQRLLHDEFQVDYALSGVYRVLHRANLAWITARSQHPKADPTVQAAFKKTL
jgi:transposase